MAREVRIVLADPSVLLRDVIRHVGAMHGVDIVGEAGRGAAIAGLVDVHRPDVLVAAAALEDGPVDAHLAVVTETVPVLVLADDPSPARLTSLLTQGVSGYYLHDCSPDELVRAIVDVAAGRVVLHPLAAATILEQWRNLRRRHGHPLRAELTPREGEVLTAMADGLPAKAIARRLGMAVKTVENHKIRIFDKLGAHTQAHAVSLAMRQGLLVAAVAGAPDGQAP